MNTNETEGDTMTTFHLYYIPANHRLVQGAASFAGGVGVTIDPDAGGGELLAASAEEALRVRSFSGKAGTIDADGKVSGRVASDAEAWSAFRTRAAKAQDPLVRELLAAAKGDRKAGILPDAYAAAKLAEIGRNTRAALLGGAHVGIRMECGTYAIVGQKLPTAKACEALGAADARRRTNVGAAHVRALAPAPTLALEAGAA